MEQMDLQKEMERIDSVIAQGPYSDTWESLCAYQVPSWYKAAKFGIFIHWGLFSVPAYANEWYTRNMYMQGTSEFEHHVKTYGPHKDFGLKDFIPMFKGEHFDPDAWTALFKEAGAQYVVPVAEHHDGFQMYRSSISHWNAAEMGPQRDVLGELKKSFEESGLTFGASSHRIEHWWFLGHGKEFESDIHEPLKRGDFYWPSMKEPEDQFDIFSQPAPSEEYMQDWLARTCEIVDRFHPHVLYFDWWIQHSALRPYLKKAAAYYYNCMAEQGESGVINYKHDAFLFGTAVPDVERGQFADVKPYTWQTDTSIGFDSWGYTTDNRYKKAQDILCDLVDIVSKNGNMLLNIGPKSDGTITMEEQDVLRSIGKWLKINGEAIYGSSTYKVCAEGPTKVEEGFFTDQKVKVFTPEDFRFTVQGGHIYAIALRGSDDGQYFVHTFAEKTPSGGEGFTGIITKAEVLGEKTPAVWEQTKEGLKVTTDYRSGQPVVIRLTLA